jgi:hypothetical protein
VGSEFRVHCHGGPGRRSSLYGHQGREARGVYVFLGRPCTMQTLRRTLREMRKPCCFEFPRSRCSYARTKAGYEQLASLGAGFSKRNAVKFHSRKGGRAGKCLARIPIRCDRKPSQQHDPLAAGYASCPDRKDASCGIRRARASPPPEAEPRIGSSDHLPLAGKTGKGIASHELVRSTGKGGPRVVVNRQGRSLAHASPIRSSFEIISVLS